MMTFSFAVLCGKSPADEGRRTHTRDPAGVGGVLGGDSLLARVPTTDPTREGGGSGRGGAAHEHDDLR